MPLLKKITFYFLGFLITGAAFFIVSEIAVRMLPYNEGFRAQPVNAENPVFHFQPNRTATASEGALFDIVNTVHMNNEGFSNQLDYDPTASTPLVAVVGDSYIEAAIVPPEESMQARLADIASGDGGRVYSFAASGAGLPQYLIWAQYARDKFKPDAFVFNIIGNDYDESLFHLQHSPGFHHFERLDNGDFKMRRIDYEPSFIRRLLRRSALAMYLITNVKVQKVLNFSVQQLGKKDRRWVSNIPRDTPEQIIDEYKWAVDTFIKALPEYTGLPYSKIILIQDGLRPAMYDPADYKEAQNSVAAIMRRYFALKAREKGIQVVDMQPAFLESFAANGKRFEFPTDGHWNGWAHELVSREVACTELFRETIGIEQKYQFKCRESAR